jgi:D-cysteine desulfhydrase
LPEGASNGIGMFGYYNAYEEILEQEKALGTVFDTIIVADGSGGTYAGLYAADQVYRGEKRIIGFNIYDPKADVMSEVAEIINEGAAIGSHTEAIDMGHMHIINDYVGEGYAIASAQVIEFIRATAEKTGVVFDPVYTGKALYGVVNEIANKNPLFKGNVLFIHTGGLFGVFPQKERFEQGR